MMDNAKQILDVLVEAQSKSVENLMEVSTKLRSAVGQANVMEYSVELYKEWYAKQESITQTMATAMKGQLINDKTPAFITELMATQEQFSQKWMEAIKDMTQNFSGAKVLDFYKDNADKIYGVWKKSFDQFTGMFTNTFGLANYDMGAQAKEMHDNFVVEARKYVTKLDEQIEVAKQTVHSVLKQS